MILTGLARLGRDAELKYLDNGTAVCNLALAFNYGKKGADGSRQTQWVDAALFGKQAEGLAQYLKKGGLINVTLSDVRVETYPGKDGMRAILKSKIIDLEFAGQNNEQKKQAENKKQSSDNEETYEDDIPF